MDSDYITSDVNQAVDDISYEGPQLSRSERLEAAYNEWISESNIKSQRKIARQYGLSSSTLNDRIKGANSWAERAQKLQRIWPEEEAVMVKTIERLQSWGWPARVQHVRFMAEQLLIARGDKNPLGLNWVHKFMARHKHLVSKFVPPLDKDRAMAQSPAILKEWFDLFQRYRTLYKVKNDNIYNMDEKGFLQGVIAKLRPLDVGVFAPLSTAYKNSLHESTRYGAGYAIDKVDFLELLKPAREKGMTMSNIQGAYTKAGLEPFNPGPILYEYRDRGNPALSIEPPKSHYSITFTTPSPPDSPVEATITCISPNGDVRNVVMTPHNSLQVKKLLEQALDMPEDAGRIAQKVGKSALHAFASATLMVGQTAQLMTLVSKKESKKKRRKGAVQGARVLNQEVLDERRLDWDWDSACRQLGDIHLNVFGLTRKKTHEERVARREAAKGKQLAKSKVTASPTKKQSVAAASPAKRGDLTTTSAEEIAEETAEETPTGGGNAEGISTAEEDSTTANNEPVVRSTKRSGVSTKRKRKKLLMGLPIRVSNQDLERGRWRRKESDLIGQPLGQGQRKRRPPTRI
ncbi:hypothetical protein G7Y79_00012g032370 [Physcia stellaris]|nr:hypothetical protein G7Y79_00012g032370 [Physcia stellaris]